MHWSFPNLPNSTLSCSCILCALTSIVRIFNLSGCNTLLKAKNMGILARHEPPNMWELRRNDELFSIFQAVGWTEFFQHLNGFHWETALQFSLNLIETHSKVWGLHIEFSEAIVDEVTGLPQVGKAWFGRRTPNPTAIQDFLREGEHIQ